MKPTLNARSALGAEPPVDVGSPFAHFRVNLDVLGGRDAKFEHLAFETVRVPTLSSVTHVCNIGGLGRRTWDVTDVPPVTIRQSVQSAL